MFDRFMNLLKGMFNKGMAKMETPEVLAEQAESELESNFKKLTEAYTSGIASEKMLESKMQKSSQELATWENRAMMAVQQNNDDMARQCLAKKQELAAAVQQLTAELANQKQTNAALKDRHGELKTKLADFRNKKNDMLTRMKAQDATVKAQELVSGSGGSGMDKWEQKIAEKEAMGQAVLEIAGSSKIEADFKEWDKKAGLDDELAALKANMGNMSSGPKLIEATTVDEKMPLLIEETKKDDDGKKK